MLEVAKTLLTDLGLGTEALFDSRLSELAEKGTVDPRMKEALRVWAQLSESELAGADHLRASHRLGETLDLLLACEKTSDRRRIGSYYTPVTVARTLIARARAQHDDVLGTMPLVCDPACGGGAFLLEAASQLAERAKKNTSSQGRAEIVDRIYGVDSSALAVAVAEVALWIFVGDASRSLVPDGHFKCADALFGKCFAEQPIHSKALGAARLFHFNEEFEQVFSGPAQGFDWIVGNPPWVAFQGRATQKISPETRSFYRRHYKAFRGYPTLHGLFIERATLLAPRGVITLLVPSSVSDLEGYRFARRVVDTGHQVSEPLLEFGQDAFEGVVQPCVGLVAAARAVPSTDPSSRPWLLHERARADSEPASVAAPEFLSRFAEMEKLPPSCFREMGFQSNRIVAAELFLRADQGDEKYTEPLLEGRNVAEFSQRPARLFLAPDQEVLSRTRCRLRPAEDYQRVDFVVRQTAAFTIAAAHQGGRFRNSLIAGFAADDLSAPFLIALLNSALFRAIHLSQQRDARQVTFPQVKLSHLRRLPRPPRSERLRPAVEAIANEAHQREGLDASQREVLDQAVFEMFGLSVEQRGQVKEYLSAIAPAALRPSITPASRSTRNGDSQPVFP